MDGVSNLLNGLGPPLQAAIITAIVTSIVASIVWLLGRRRDQRNLTLEIHKQYYLADMGKYRRAAANFILANCDVDWSSCDPYKLPGEEDQKDSYSEIVRFFHRLGVLYKENEIRKSLARRLLAREYGFWYTILFEPMAKREDWWTKSAILDLVKLFAYNEGAVDFEEGAKAGRERWAKARANKNK